MSLELQCKVSKNTAEDLYPCGSLPGGPGHTKSSKGWNT